MQQIYRRPLMPKCDSNKVAKQFYRNHTSVWVFSCKFMGYFLSPKDRWPNPVTKSDYSSLKHLWMAASASIISLFRTSNWFCKEYTPLREKCPNTELFLVCIFLYSMRIQETTDQKNSVFGHFSRNAHP